MCVVKAASVHEGLPHKVLKTVELVMSWQALFQSFDNFNAQCRLSGQTSTYSIRLGCWQCGGETALPRQPFTSTVEDHKAVELLIDQNIFRPSKRSLMVGHTQLQVSERTLVQ